MNNQDQSKTEGGGAVASSDLLARVKQLYPDMGEEPFYGPGNYQSMIDSFGEVVLQVDDSNYQGDTRVILKRGDEYGLLIFGWGSCSGCDALQACDTYKEIEDLRQQLESDIKWMSAKDMLNYIETHDWKGDYSWHAEETQQFVEKAKTLMRERANVSAHPRASENSASSREGERPLGAAPCSASCFSRAWRKFKEEFERILESLVDTNPFM